MYYPKRTNKELYLNLTKQCQKMDIPFLSFLPSEPQLVANAYNVIIDAVFGFSFKGPVKPEFVSVIETMVKSQLPIVSIDVPSGKLCILSIYINPFLAVMHMCVHFTLHYK